MAGSRSVAECSGWSGASLGASMESELLMRVIQTQHRAYGVDLAGAPSACAPGAAARKGPGAPFLPGLSHSHHAHRHVPLGRSFDMVAMFDIVFLIVCALLGLWWISRTSRFRSPSACASAVTRRGRSVQPFT